MIIDHLDRRSTLVTLPNYAKLWLPILNWITQVIAKDIPFGKHDLNLPEVPGGYARVDEANTHLYIERKFEAHERYVDVQYCWREREFIYVADRWLLSPHTGYDSEEDVSFYKEPTDRSAIPIQMVPGRIAIFLPNDAHKTLVNDGVSRKVRKIVVKVPYNLVITNM